MFFCKIALKFDISMRKAEMIEQTIVESSLFELEHAIPAVLNDSGTVT